MDRVREDGGCEAPAGGAGADPVCWEAQAIFAVFDTDLSGEISFEAKMPHTIASLPYGSDATAHITTIIITPWRHSVTTIATTLPCGTLHATTQCVTISRIQCSSVRAHPPPGGVRSCTRACFTFPRSSLSLSGTLYYMYVPTGATCPESEQYPVLYAHVHAQVHAMSCPESERYRHGM